MSQNKIFQCCYTNAEKEIGGKMTSGWQPVAVSPDIPSDAYNACVKIQNSNIPSRSDLVDETGKALKLYEFHGDGNYIYVVCTQYGLSDRVGRPNMFSHGVVFPASGASVAIQNPNFFLALSEKSFKLSEEQVGEGSLAWDEKEKWFSLKTALEEANLDRQRYGILVRCIFAQMSGGDKTTPLFVKFDGMHSQFKAVLFCIYCGLPLFMRRRIKISSSALVNSGKNNLVFAKHAPDGSNYVDLTTGENNILTPRLERKMTRYGFVDHAVANLPFSDFDNYFVNLENIVVSLGDASGSNEQLMKIAHQFLTQRDDAGFSDEEVESNLCDALRISSSKNRILEMVVLRMVREVNRRKIKLTDEAESLLDKWLEFVELPDLKRAIEVHKSMK